MAEGQKTLEAYQQSARGLGNFCEQTTSQTGCEDACNAAARCAGYAFRASTSHCVLSVSGDCPPGVEELAFLDTGMDMSQQRSLTLAPTDVPALVIKVGTIDFVPTLAHRLQP